MGRASPFIADMGLLDFLRGNSAPAPQKRRASPSGRVAARSILQAANTGRLESTWTATPQTADAIIFQEALTIIARSRQMCGDSDTFRKFLQLCRDNIAGPCGFKFSANIKDPSGTLDTAATNAIEEAFCDWSRPLNYDTAGILSRADSERLAITTAAMDGEAIGVIHFGKSAGPWGFSVQLIDPVRLDHRHYEKLPNGNTIRHGIECDANNRPLRYWFRNFDERMQGYQTWATSREDQYTIVDAENVVHWFVPELVGQKRGLPWTRTALWSGRQLTAFRDAVVVNARVGAAKMGFFRAQDGEEIEGDELPMDAEPGVFEDIGDREFLNWNPQFPDQVVESFMRAMQRSQASGLGVSYHNLSNDLTSVNFSSIRQGALDEREVWKGLQESFIWRWCWPIYEKWLERALLAEKILINGKPLRFERIDKYKQVTFRGRRWAWIDPSAEQTANEKAVGQAFTSRSRVIEDMGGDPQEVWDEIQRENAELEKRNITPLAPAGSAPAEPAKPAQDPKQATA
jgi:lambda family phage portal protein